MSVLKSKAYNPDFTAKNFSLKSTSGKLYTLDDFSDFEAMLVIFTCNHCPYAKASWPILMDLHKKYGEKIAFVAINPNDDNEYPEDSFESMKEFSKAKELSFPYLRDDTQKVAKSYNAMCTPDPFLFVRKDKNFNLYYHGQINDNWQEPDKVSENNLEDSIKLLLDNKDSPPDQPFSIGCSIKWKNID